MGRPGRLQGVPWLSEEDATVRRTLLLVVAGLLALTARTADAAVKGKDITFKSGTEEIKGYLAVPEGKGPFPAVVVIQEWWGLNNWVKEQADRLAGQGYVALAPDLYRGKVATEPRVAMKLMSGLPRDRAVRDLKGAVNTLAALDNVDKSKLGSIGWCMGGGFSLQLALADKRVKACVICYGRVPTNAKALAPLRATVLGIFGEEDKGIPPETVKQFEQAMKKAGKKVAGIREYKAGHGFMREGGGAYNARATKAAWAQIDKFLASTLKGK
jgi:carboxymethylenebutenolidase